MGQKATKENPRSKEGTNILLAGLYKAGKRTLVQKLATHDPKLVSVYSTEKGEHRNLTLSTWDLGGRSLARPLIRHYVRIFDAIVYIVDSTQRACLVPEFMKDTLQFALSEDGMEKPILVLANKQDLPGALTCQQVAEELGLSQISSDRSVEILPLSLETGEGLPELREWLERLERAKLLRETVIKPLEKAVPPTVKSHCSKMSSALKQAFGMVKSKMSPSS